MSKKLYDKTLEYLGRKKKILFITTSNRWTDELPKSTQLAKALREEVGPSKVEIIDAFKLNIVPCEGNVSTKEGGNHCGSKGSQLKDSRKNPSGHHRCWANINSPEDELWKISRELLESDAVVFFGSIRWGKVNATYAKLIERLTWLENRHTALGESNLVKNIDAGVIALGHNFNVEQAVKLEKENLTFFGFKVPNELSWGWQWSKNSSDEGLRGYKEDIKDFTEEFSLDEHIEECVKRFGDFIKKG